MGEAAWPDESLLHAPWVRSLARALVHDLNDAEDLVQETWLRVLVHPPRDRAMLRPWITRVMRRLAQERWRTHERRSRLGTMLAEQRVTGTPEETAMRLETQQVMAQVVLDLPEPYRTTVRLHYFDAWSFHRIAGHEGTSVRAIETRMRRARAMIRDGLERRGPPEKWVPCLMLAAQPYRLAVSGMTIALGAAASLLAMGGLAWLARGWLGIAPATPPAAARAPALPAATWDAALGAAAAPSLPPAVGRTEALTVIPFELRDAVSGAALEGVAARAVVMDSTSLGLDEFRWTSSAAAAYFASVPASASLVRVFVEGTATHAGLEEQFVRSLSDHRLGQPFVVGLQPRTGAVRGIVVDRDGVPQAGARIGAWSATSSRAGRTPDFAVLSAADGSFAMPRAKAAGSSLLLALDEPDICTEQFFLWQDGDPAERLADGVVLVRIPGARLRVVALDARDRPVAEAKVNLTPTMRRFAGPRPSVGRLVAATGYVLTTDASGATPTVPVGHDSWHCQISHPDFLHVAHDIQPSGTEWVVRLEPTPVARGRVLDEHGAGIAGARLIAEGPGGKAQTVTDAAGSYAIGHPGRADEAVRWLVLPPAPLAPATFGPFLPAEAARAGDLVLGTGESLELELRNADGSALGAEEVVIVHLDGGPLAEPWDEEARRENLVALALQERASAAGGMALRDGFLRLEGLPRGRYLASCWGDTGCLAAAEVEIAAAAESLRLRRGGYPDPRGALHGRAVGPGEGQLAPQLLISLRRADGPETWSWSVKTRQGEFRLEGIPAGTWQAFVQAGERFAPWAIQDLEIPAGGERRIEVLVEEAFEGCLRLRDGHGVPLGGCQLRAFDAAGRAVALAPSALALRTDGEGLAWLGSLPLGRALRLEVRRGEGAWQPLPEDLLDPAAYLWEATLEP